MDIFFMMIFSCFPVFIRSNKNADNILLVKKVQSNGGAIYEGAHDKFYDFIRNSDILVDKSLMLKVLLSDHQASPLILLTAPCRFGKSTAMKMLQFFLHPELKENGLVKEQSATKPYQFFKEGKILTGKGTEEFITKPSICHHDDFVKKHLAKYPVIFLNLVTLKGSHNYDEFMSHFKRMVVEMLREHFVAIKSLCVSKQNAFGSTTSEGACSEKDYEGFRQIFDKGEINNLEEVVVDLTRVLKEYYNNSVVILIDEYDSFITKMYTTEGIIVVQDEKQRIEEFFLTFLEETLLNNKNIYKGFLTGILPLSLNIDPSGSNSIQHFRHTNKDFYRFYGFTREEVEKLFEFRKISPELAEQAYVTYDGYHIENDAGIKIFNTWSIVKFVNSRKIDYYWAYAGGVVLKRRTVINPRYEDIVMTLLAEKCWKYTQLYQLPFSSLSHLESLLTSRDLNDFPVATGEIFLWFLSASGFLTVEDHGNGSVCMKIASNENRDLISATFFGTTLRYKHQKVATGALHKITGEKNRTLDDFIKEYKGILLADSSGAGVVPHRSEVWYQVKFLDIIKKTAMIYNYAFAAAEFSPEKSKKDESRPDFIMFNETHGVVVEMRCQTKKKLKESVDEELLPHGRQFFQNNPKAKLVRLIFISIRVKSKKIRFTDFSYTSLNDIPKNVPSIPYLNIVSL